jgi:hypothetical protein
VEPHRAFTYPAESAALLSLVLCEAGDVSGLVASE